MSTARYTRRVGGSARAFREPRPRGVPRRLPDDPPMPAWLMALLFVAFMAVASLIAEGQIG